MTTSTTTTSALSAARNAAITSPPRTTPPRAGPGPGHPDHSDSSITIQLAFRSIYNVYNILAAYAACRLAGVDGKTIVNTVSNYILKNGRMQTFTLGGHHGTLLTSKHENSIAYDTNSAISARRRSAPVWCW